MGHIGADDAGVYRLDDERALVLTVDFFTPIVDDPYEYGMVAATNSLSDVYAMGGRPLVALNIAAFPEDFPGDVIAEVFKGGAAVARNADIVIAGGHTVRDKEIKYGLAVAGLVHPLEIVKNSGAKPGDVLILTKPLGTGVLSTALKMDALGDDYYRPLVSAMTQLNRHASEQMVAFGVNACTDITGNGLLGHAFEMAQASGVTFQLSVSSVPELPGAIEMIRQGYLTAGGRTNRLLIEGEIEWERDYDETLDHFLLDPQTSGGLLISVPAERAQDLFARIKEIYTDAAIVGQVVEKIGTLLRLV